LILNRIQMLVLILVLVILPIFVSDYSLKASAVTPSIDVTYPYVPRGEPYQIFSWYGEGINVNVTSNVSLLNVTLYYESLPYNDTSSQSQNLSNYKAVNMTLGTGNPTNGTYYYDMPRQPNDSRIIGAAAAFSQNSSSRVEFMDPLYFVLDPTPMTNLTLELAISDFNQSSTLLNMTMYGQIYDSTNHTGYYYPNWYSNTYSQIPRFLTQTDYTDWSTTYYGEPGSFVASYPTLSDPVLFPFDSYQYSFSITLQSGVNYTSVIFLDPSNGDQVSLKPGINYINYSLPAFAKTADLADWRYSTYMSYFPENGNNSAKIDFLIRFTGRSPSEFYPLVIPVISMYGFLGGSIILQKRKAISDRLAIYLAVVAFSFVFFLGIGALGNPPSIFGLDMIQLTTLGLIPSTAILAITSMLGDRFRHQRLLLDAIGLLLSLIAVGLFTSVSGYNYLDLGTWSWYLVLSFLFGWLITVAIPISTRIRGWRRNSTELY